MRMYPDLFHYVNDGWLPDCTEGTPAGGRLYQLDWSRPTCLILSYWLQYFWDSFWDAQIMESGLQHWGKVVIQVCDAIVAELHDDISKIAATVEEWKTVATWFKERWNLLHFMGVLGGKHCKITQTPHSGNLYTTIRSSSASPCWLLSVPTTSLSGLTSAPMGLLRCQNLQPF